MDVLPPLAEAEFHLIRNFLKCFTAFGYKPVIPPMAEYAATLDDATRSQVLQMADPLAPQMLALRADMTGQVARIAGGALGTSPRPLRLCYAGYTLRAQAEALQTRRQHTQVGIERFGDIDTRSIAEVMGIAAHALANAGVTGITIDLHFSRVMQALLEVLPSAKHAAIRDAAAMKDTAQLRALGAGVIAEVLDSSGEATAALAKLKKVNHPAVADAATQLAALVDALAKQQVDATVTIDMLDLSGFGYYCGIGYALYWNQAGLEVGRGGCYETASGEKAVGFTLYLNDLLERLPQAAGAPIRVIPYGTPAKDAEKLQDQGFVTVYGEK